MSNTRSQGKVDSSNTIVILDAYGSKYVERPAEGTTERGNLANLEHKATLMPGTMSEGTGPPCSLCGKGIVIKDAENNKYVARAYEGTAEKGRGVFEWVVENGKYAGKGCLYEGEYCSGMFEGQGKLQDANGYIYEGNFHRGASHGHGVCHWPNGDVYEGEWRNDLREGQGICRQIGEGGTVMNGEWKNDKLHGKAHLKIKGGGEYKGDFRNNKIHGKGYFTYPDGNTYRGSFRNNKRHGHGTMVYADLSKYTGEWKKSLREGYGTYTFRNKDKFVGTFYDDDMLNGFLHLEDGFAKRVHNGKVV